MALDEICADFQIMGVENSLDSLRIYAKDGDQTAFQDGKIWAEDIQTVISALRLSKAILAGWSYGGFIICDTSAITASSLWLHQNPWNIGRCTLPTYFDFGHTSGIVFAIHFTSAAFTSSGFSCANQWPERMVSSVRFRQ
jgi:hypothetical protein